jgi:hypothetical protein
MFNKWSISKLVNFLILPCLAIRTLPESDKDVQIWVEQVFWLQIHIVPSLTPLLKGPIPQSLMDIALTRGQALAEREPMLCTAEMSPSHYLPHLNPKSFSYQLTTY